MLSEEDVKQICPKAERVIYTAELTHVDIGIKVGLFSQGITLTSQMKPDDQRARVRDLYMGLVIMNRRNDEQIRKAREEADAARR